MLTLATILRANAVSCLVFGLIFIITPTAVALFLDNNKPAPDGLILVLGAGLIINGIHLLWVSTRQKIPKSLVIYFSTGDYLWLAFTLILMLTGTWITTLPGIVSTSIVSTLVGLFGLLQQQKIK